MTEEASTMWPVHEFRPLPAHTGATVLRYADGAWLPDDGQWDIAFVSYGMGPAFGLGVEIPHQRNLLWKGLTGSWRGSDPHHPRGGNPWHYMLRDGETEFGDWKTWGRSRDVHLNERAFRAAMSKCCSINSVANGRGPAFELGDAYVAASLLRIRDTKEVVKFPERPICMYCGDRWPAKIAAGGLAVPA